MTIIWTSPSLTEPRGRRHTITWSAFAARVEAAREAPTKDGLARWAPVAFRGDYRARANVQRCYACVLDLDDGSSLDRVEAALGGLMLIVHSTFRATAEVPRWRVVVPLDQCVDADAYERVWRWLAMAIEGEGGQPDYQGRDPPHAWAVPARPPSGHYVAHVDLAGAMCSVADALVAIPRPEPMAAPRTVSRGDSYDDRVARARAYLAKMDPGIQGSHGSTATIKAVLAMVRGFALEPDDALALLVEHYNPRCLPPWSVLELRRKVNDAWRKGRMPFGAISDRGMRRMG